MSSEELKKKICFILDEESLLPTQLCNMISPRPQYSPHEIRDAMMELLVEEKIFMGADRKLRTAKHIENLAMPVSELRND